LGAAYGAYYIYTKPYTTCLPLILINLLLLKSGNVARHPGPDTSQSKSLSICHLNIRSILAPTRLEEFEDYIKTLHHFDVVALTETFLDASIQDSQISLQGYTIYRNDRDRRGGGVAFYIADHLQSVRRLDLENQHTEMIWVEINYKKKKLLFSCVYRPPNMNSLNIISFLDILHEKIDLATSNNPLSITLLGDFNDRCSTWKSLHSTSELDNKLVDLMNLLNITQLIEHPTRGENILDLLLTDTPNLFLNSGVIPSLSNLDHDAIFGTFKLSYPTSSSYLRHVWYYDRGNFDSLNETFDNVPWPGVINDDDTLDEITENVTNIILNTAKEKIPNRIVKIKPNDKPWFNKDLRKLFKTRNRWHKKQKRTQNPLHIEIYKQKRSVALNAYRDAKYNYYNNITTKLLDPTTTVKTYWKLLKNTKDSQNDTSIPTMLDNDNLITDNKDKAELLNDYFIEQSKLPDGPLQPPTVDIVTDARLDHIIITPTIVKQVLLQLDVSKSTGPDQISNKILKNCADSLCLPLSILFNKSLELGQYPSSWKLALVTAIFKKLSKQIKSNYRPISLLCCISKVFERIVFNSTYQHLTINNLLDDENSGFKKDDSAILKLLALTDSIYKGLDDQEEILLTFLDITKAFDKVWHQGLITKLQQVGINGTLLEWYSDYLLNRCQRVVVGGKSSDIKQLHAGVPQGSILGPLLFLIYVGDITHNSKCKAYKFADDITYRKNIAKNKHEEAVNILNTDLDNTLSWSYLWRVSFSAPKSCFMRITTKHNKPDLDPIIMDQSNISEVQSQTYLGLTISNNMQWNEHINRIITKASARVHQLRKFQYKLPRIALEKIYTSMIRPILEYGDIIFDNMPFYLSQQLENVQRRAALICTGAYRHTEHAVLLRELGWQSLTNRRYQRRLTSFYTLLNGPTPNHILSHIPTSVSNSTHYDLRNKSNLRPPQTRLHSSLNSYFPRTARDWNNLPIPIRASLSKYSFKKAITPTMITNPYAKTHYGKSGAWISRIRMGLSALNAQRFSYNLTESPVCLLCNNASETPLHYLWECPAHTLARLNMVTRIVNETEVEQVTARNILQLTISGNVEKSSFKTLFDITTEYMIKSARFK
jgi:hypothetical protein